jgi:hypothetical protein
LATIGRAQPDDVPIRVGLLDAHVRKRPKARPALEVMHLRLVILVPSEGEKHT